MTEERIAALEAMCQEAEKEPWHTDSSPYNESAPFMVRTPNGWVVAEGITHVMDAEFIAYARTALPELLAEVRRLQAEKAKLWAFADEVEEMAERDSTADVLIQELRREVSL